MMRGWIKKEKKREKGDGCGGGGGGGGGGCNERKIHYMPLQLQGGRKTKIKRIGQKQLSRETNVRVLFLSEQRDGHRLGSCAWDC